MTDWISCRRLTRSSAILDPLSRVPDSAGVGSLSRRGRPRPSLLLEIAYGDPVQGHGVRRHAVRVLVLERGVAAAEMPGDDQPPPLDHLGVGRREFFRGVVALVDHHALVLTREVVLDDPAVHGRVGDGLPEAPERALETG